MKKLLLPVVFVGIAMIGACDIVDFANEDQKQQIEQMDSQIQELESMIQSQQEAFEKAMKDAESAVRNADLEKFNQARQDANSAFEAHQALVAQYDEAVKQQREVFDEIYEDTTEPFIPFLPPGPLQIIAPALLAFLFERPRDVVKNSVKHASHGAMGKAVKGLTLDFFGLTHSKDGNLK